MSPADVAENLMPKSDNSTDADTCLACLIQALETLKAEESQGKESRKEETKEISLSECVDDSEESKSEVNSDSSEVNDNSSST